MPNHSRRHLGLYYLVLERGMVKGVTSTENDYSDFIDLLLSVLAGTGYKLYAFCLLPGQTHLAVQMSHVPLADFMQRLATRYNRLMQQKYERCGDLKEIQEPKLFDRSEKLRALIRFIHLLPLRIGRNPNSYLWSSQKAYLGKTRMTCIDVRSGLRLFGQHNPEARTSYEEYFQEGIQAVTSAKRSEPQVSLERQKNRTVETLRTIYEVESLDELVASISQMGNRQVEDVRSCSRERLCSLLRAMIMWHATRLEFASATEVSQYLRRDPSSLYSAVKHYSALYPDLFRRPGDFQELANIPNVRDKRRSIEVHRISFRPPSLVDSAGPN